MAIIKKKRRRGGGGLLNELGFDKKKNKRNIVYMSNYHKIY